MNTEKEGLVVEKEKYSIQEIKPDDVEYLEVYEEDYKSSKERLRKAMTDRAAEEGYSSLEEFAADFYFKCMFRETGLSKQDEVALKFLRFLGEAEGWTNATKEFTVKSNVPTLSKKSLLSI